MKTIKRTLILALMASVSLLFSCAKDGKDGLPGPAGPAGNANVKSQTFVVNTWDWSSNSVLLYDPNITQAIVNNGAVQVYVQGDPGVWMALPLTISGSYIVYDYQLNYVRIITDSQPTTLERFKVVAIASSARLANPDVDYTNYEEVKATFNLED